MISTSHFLHDVLQQNYHHKKNHLPSNIYPCHEIDPFYINLYINHHWETFRFHNHALLSQQKSHHKIRLNSFSKYPFLVSSHFEILHDSNYSIEHHSIFQYRAFSPYSIVHYRYSDGCCWEKWLMCLAHFFCLYGIGPDSYIGLENVNTPLLFSYLPHYNSVTNPQYKISPRNAIQQFY